MKFMKHLTLGGAVLALVFNAGIAAAKSSKGPVFTISEGQSETIMPTSGPMPIPLGTTGYSNALVTVNSGHSALYKFTFMGCGDSGLDNRFFVEGSKKSFDCKTSQIGDSFKVNLKADAFGPHSPFHFQAAGDNGGPSVFNGEGPFDGTYTNGNEFSNTSIFYAIGGSTTNPGETSGNVVLLGLADGGGLHDNDHQDLVVELSLKNQP